MTLHAEQSEPIAHSSGCLMFALLRISPLYPQSKLYNSKLMSAQQWQHSTAIILSFSPITAKWRQCDSGCCSVWLQIQPSVCLKGKLLQQYASVTKRYNKLQNRNDTKLANYCSVSKRFNTHDDFTLSANEVLKALCLKWEEKGFSFQLLNPMYYFQISWLDLTTLRFGFFSSMTLTNAKNSPLSHWGHLVTFLPPGTP